MKRKGCIRTILLGLASLTGLCLVLAAISTIINSRQPTHSSLLDRLSAVEKARVAEAIHLRKTLGDQVFPGWAQADIPVIVYNEEMLFLVDVENPGEGWRRIPKGTQEGKAWLTVPDDNFFGESYYRQKYPSPGVNTQAFTVQVGNQWAASLSTYEWTRIALVNEIVGQLPGPIQRIVPAPLLRNLLLPGSDAYASMILHEATHAYQGIRDPERLAGAEQAAQKTESSYPFEDEAHREGWQAELDLLYNAMRAETQEETLRLAREFLNHREERRKTMRLSDDMLDFERLKEWEEGIAKYSERTIYLLAMEDKSYQPLPEVFQDEDFHDYRLAKKKWNQEVDQMRRMAGDEGDGRFYYTGFAQAVLLDRLSPGWKDRLFDEDVWLEDLLAEAVQP